MQGASDSEGSAKMEHARIRDCETETGKRGVKVWLSAYNAQAVSLCDQKWPRSVSRNGRQHCGLRATARA